jgi:hypothetical protein
MPQNLKEDFSEHCITKKITGWQRKIVSPRTADRETGLRHGSCQENVTPM